MALLLVLLLAAAASGQLLDELDVVDHACLGEDTFECLGGGCVSRDQYCDGRIDCPDGSDENFCPNHLPDALLCNQTHHYLCEDKKKCIPTSWLCNNETDCDDGSDEVNCTALEIPAGNSTCKGFQCDGDRCISRLWLCDGIYDCEDKTDEYSEEICRNARYSHSLHDTTVCEETPERHDKTYRCKDATFCLPKQFMCDGIADCRDASDEGDFCTNWDKMCVKDKNPCKGNKTLCHPDREGPVCTCASPAMMRYNYTSEACEDVDECTLARPLCSHVCENRIGHFNCRCDQGYSLDGFGYLCYADGPEAMLFYTTKTDIRYMKVKTKQEVVVATGLKQAHGVSYDGKYLYWVETAQGHQAIMRAQFDDVQNTKEVLVSLGLEEPGDLALDWAGGHVYFSDARRGSIAVCRTDGALCTTLATNANQPRFVTLDVKHGKLRSSEGEAERKDWRGSIAACRTDGALCTTLATNAKQPRFVTLDVKHGKMYWADWHHRPVIMAANMDGSSPEVLVDSLSTFASGLALDVPNGRLYFVDRTIRVCKIDDKQTFVLFQEPFHHPYAVAVFENTVFWSDWTSNTVQTMDKLHGTSVKRNVLATLSSPVFDMHIYHPVLINRTHNPCENKTCSHLCLASGAAAACACPDGMELRGDVCEHIDGYRPLYLIVGGGTSFIKLDYNSLGNPESHTTPFDLGRVQAMAYDNTRDTLYIYDGQRKSLNSINMMDFSLGITHVLLYRGLENVVDMDYDYASDSLYILDAGRRFIEVVSLRTQQRAMITRFRDQEIPISLCVMPDYGRLLVAVLDSEHGNTIHIDSIGLDGEDRKRIVSNDLQGPRVRLRYDQNMDVVYVADEGNSVIDLMHPEGTGRETFRELSTTVTSIAVTDPYVFWTDRRTRLYWSNMHEATHHIRKIEFSIFPENNQLHVQATSAPPDRNSPLLSHPCLTSHPCSHVCVQTPHAPLSVTHRRGNSSHPLTFKCLCPPGLLLVEGKCTQLAHCKAGELYCHRSNVCFPKGKYCDGFKDCSDGEDEEDCEEKPKDYSGCSTGYKLCNGLCIENGKQCGDYPTTSTSRTTLAPTRCSSSEFECANSSICIERSQMCDGQPDCLNGSDEDSALCELFACQTNEFMCTLGSCILEVFKCDGENDCADGSDEVDCDNKVCGLGYYQCRSKECIEFKKRCDGNQDCVDYSDEEDCEEPVIVPDIEPEHHCAEGEYTCQLNRSICLPPTARCNMKIECPGGMDEAGCDFRCAPLGLWECKQEFLCVSYDLLCNGFKDCLDGSDETQDACSRMNKTSRLYPPMLLPAEECRDGFLCGSGQCLEWRQVCDGELDCWDGSDEKGLCDSACENNTCAISCQPTPTGARCLCGPGLRAAGRACMDEDECEHQVCSQECHNLPGSFLCSCHHGYALRPDRRSCKANKGDLAILYMSGNTVWSIAADGRGSVLYNDPKNAAIADMDVDVRQNKLYISLTEAGQLVEVNSSKTDVTVTNVGHPTKIAVDWITGNVYFVDVTPSANCIRVCNVWKKRCAKLQKLPINTKVTALVVDPPSGLMFYCTSREASSVVWAASLGGRRAADVLAARCAGLAVDSFKRRLYVAETDPPRVFSVDFNGENQQTVLDEHLHQQAPHGLALFEDSVFFLINNSLKLNRCSLFGRKRCEPFIYRVLGADTFVLRHESAQRGDMPNLCEDVPCSHLCVLEENGPVCLCDEGMPAVDGTCRLMEKEQLPLFNGWTAEEYARAHHATLTAVAVILVLCAAYLVVFLYYHFVHRPRVARQGNYLEVRFQNSASSSAPATTVVQLPPEPTTSGGHEFVNPLEYVRDLWEQVRKHNRPVGTAGLDIDIPYVQQDLSDTESDLDERDTKSIIRK